MIHLDTSFLIRALRAGSGEDQQLRTWLREGQSVAISAVSWAEFLCGPVEAGHVALAKRVVGEAVAFTAADSSEAARLFNLAGRRRGSLADRMVAAVALRAGAALATSDPEDFRRLGAAGLGLAQIG